MDDWQLELKPMRAVPPKASRSTKVDRLVSGSSSDVILTLLAELRESLARIEDRITALEHSLGASTTVPRPAEVAAPAVRALRRSPNPSDPFDMKLMARRMRAAVTDETAPVSVDTGAGGEDQTQDLP